MKCHICSTPYRSISQKHYQCPGCEHRFYHYTGDEIAYHRHQYRKDVSHHRSKGEFDSEGQVTPEFHAARKLICEQRLLAIKSYLNRKSRCLDVGSGAGTFAHTIRPYVKSVTCNELSPPLLAECKRLGFETIDSDFLQLFADGLLLTDCRVEYDLITAWHVLEHVTNARMFIQTMHQLLPFNGKIVIEIPIDRNFENDVYDGHVHYFSKHSLTMLIESNGFKLISMNKGVQKPSLLAIAGKI